LPLPLPLPLALALALPAPAGAAEFQIDPRDVETERPCNDGVTGLVNGRDHAAGIGSGPLGANEAITAGWTRDRGHAEVTAPFQHHAQSPDTCAAPKRH
jgi:hypothetical protein